MKYMVLLLLFLLAGCAGVPVVLVEPTATPEPAPPPSTPDPSVAVIQAAQSLPYLTIAEVDRFHLTHSHDEWATYRRSIVGRWIDKWPGRVQDPGLREADGGGHFAIIDLDYGQWFSLVSPIEARDRTLLQAGDRVEVSGVLYSAGESAETGLSFGVMYSTFFYH